MFTATVISLGTPFDRIPVSSNMCVFDRLDDSDCLSMVSFSNSAEIKIQPITSD